ncbi:bifunctional diguanylate cyclase/phosphodiesterase [Actinoplanes sp. NPDC023714]|uniref:putative bifunctional diguanylate cyclase/phosphodiesterase n=1 Tax=Actinoplanes sp. NPDC023714 TaxID=3154322 RepID=UPI0033E4E5F8
MRGLSGVLGIVLVAVSGYAMLGSWEQSGIVSRIAADSTDTDAYQRAAYLTSAEMVLIQAAMREPDGEERDELFAAHARTQAAMMHMAARDDEHREEAAGVAQRHRDLEPTFEQYLRQLDRGDTAGAQASLENVIEPAVSVIMEEVLAEQRYHLDEYTRNQEAGTRQSERLKWGSVLAFLTGVVLLLLFARASWANRRRLERMAVTDPLTGLPNRAAFAREAQAALDHGPVTILAVNLDGFRDVNEQLGHRIGDLLLQQAGERLRASVREGDLVARIGGDDFAVLLVESEDDPEAVGRRLTRAFDRPFAIDELTIDLEVSIGAATAGTGDTVASVLQHADTAMDVAKRRRLGFSRYTSEHGNDSIARLGLLGDLRRALDAGTEITLHYQPQIDLATGDLAGVEALARWQHPGRGRIPPGDFIPVLETTGLIHRFTDHVLEIALAQARSWLDDGLRIPVSVNISARTLLDPGFCDRVADHLRRWGVPGGQLCIEVTEHSVMTDPGTAIDVLQHIRDMGVRTSIDDYGTGYSSMTYLRLLPLDELKIDRSFVAGMARDPGHHALVASTVELGHNLGLSVVAEGTEDLETIMALQRLGCDVAQGYYFAAPLEAGALIGKLPELAETTRRMRLEPSEG